MTDLAELTCVPCRGGVPPLGAEEVQALAVRVPDWSVRDNHHLERTWTFPDFAAALRFVNAAGAVAEEQRHHPEMLLAWGTVRVTIWTHKIKGLTESDFILAAKLDRIVRPCVD